MNLHVLVNNEEQMAAALLCEAVSEIYVEADAFEKSAIARCHEKNKKCIIALPYIFRDVTFIDVEDYDGVLIRSLDELVAYAGCGIGRNGFEIISDYGLYAMNEHAAKFLSSYGARRVTLPVELNVYELKELIKRMHNDEPGADSFILSACEPGATDTEMIIYGFIPMMVSAQCIKKNVSGCNRVPDIMQITDRKGNHITVENKCAYCYNLIYNPMPMSLFGVMDKAEGIGADSYRINFTGEDGQEAQRVLDTLADPSTFTRGHFTRGVE